MRKQWPRELAEVSGIIITMLPGPPEVEGEKLLSRDFTTGGKVEYHSKDLGIALAAGREYGVTLPVTALVEQMFGVLEAKGRGRLGLLGATERHRGRV